MKITTVRLGSSGLKVSKIILGCMSYGSPDWQNWVLPEKEAIEHIKFAYVLYLDVHTVTVVDRYRSYDAGINTFDTANVS